MRVGSQTIGAVRSFNIEGVEGVALSFKSLKEVGGSVGRSMQASPAQQRTNFPKHVEAKLAPQRAALRTQAMLANDIGNNFQNALSAASGHFDRMYPQGTVNSINRHINFNEGTTAGVTRSIELVLKGKASSEFLAASSAIADLQPAFIEQATRFLEMKQAYQQSAANLKYAEKLAFPGWSTAVAERSVYANRQRVKDFLSGIFSWGSKSPTSE